MNRGDDLDPGRTVVVQGDGDRHQLLDDPGDRPQVLRQPGTGERRRAVGEREERHELVGKVDVDVGTACPPVEQGIDGCVGDSLGRQAAPPERREAAPVRGTPRNTNVPGPSAVVSSWIAT